MKRPNLSLSIDIEEDIHNVLNFLECEKNPQILDKFLLPEAKALLGEDISSEGLEEKTRAFVTKFYEDNDRTIKKGLEEAKVNWTRFDDGYYRYVEELFNSRGWLSNEYRGVSSIFGLYPREIDRKLFFFPYRYNIERFSNMIIGHEMLHFMFFDFLFDRYQLRENSRLEGKSDNYIWQLSEAFNSAIEGDPRYQDSIGIKYDVRPYTGQEGMVALIKEQMAKEKNIGKLLDKWIIGA